MSDTPADPPKPSRVLPRAARLSRLTPVETPAEAVTHAADVVATDPVVTPRAPSPAPSPVPSPPPSPAPADRMQSAVAAPQPPTRTPIGATSSEVVDLARSIANSSPPAAADTAPIEPIGTGGAIASRAMETGLPLRSVATTSYTPAPGQSTGPVTFKPLVDRWANRSVIVASFGLVLCFFPLVSLVGLVMGAISLRRISTSGGSLIGARTARFGVMLGGAGCAIGIAFGVWFLATQ